MTRAVVRQTTDTHVEGRADMVNAFADLRSAIREDTKILIRWMFFFWLATVIPLSALFIALLHH